MTSHLGKPQYPEIDNPYEAISTRCWYSNGEILVGKENLSAETLIDKGF